MAKNIHFETGNQLSVPVPTGTKSGDPVVFGDLGGVALTGRAADGTATVKFDGVADLVVKGVDTNGNAAISPGDLIYLVAADTPKLSKKTSGVRFGVAMGSVTGGSTTTIPVRLG